MTFMMRLVPHDGEKQRGKSLSTPLEPDGYALSPSVNTTLSTLAALSTASTLSTILPVDSSPLVPHTAMSPAPIITAPASASSVGAAPGGICVASWSREQQSTSPGNATDHSSFPNLRTRRSRAPARGDRGCLLYTSPSPRD